MTTLLQERSHLLPHITEEHVRDGLKALLYSYPNQKHHRDANPLHYLILVDERLLAPGKMQSGSIRALEFGILLTEFITEALMTHRLNLGMKFTDATSSVAESLTHISTDLETENFELIGWSWLYYRYVRVDLNLKTDDFRRLGNFVSRTYQRIQAHAVRRLTELIYKREVEASKRVQREQLLSMIPRRNDPIFGRDAESRYLASLHRILFPYCVYVFGAPGVGKTTWVAQNVCASIQNSTIEQIIWIESPTTLREIEQAEVGKFGLSLPDLNHYAATHAVSIVLDSVEDWQDDVAELNRLISTLSYLKIYITSRKPLKLRTTVAYIKLENLSYLDASTFIRHYEKRHFRAWKSPLENWQIFELWRETEGHPLRLKEALTDLFAGD